MKAISFYFLLSILPVMAIITQGCSSPATTITGPGGVIEARVTTTADGRLLYSVYREGEAILIESSLGVVMGNSDFSTGLKLENVSEPILVEGEYTLVTGKQVNHHYEAVEQTLSFRNRDNLQMDVIFRIFEHGIAFRYFFPGDTGETLTIASETTSFNFPEGTLAWLSPMSEAKTGWESTNPSYEEHYFYAVHPGTEPPLGAGWVYPALFRYNNVWMLVSEADLHRHYCGTRLVPGPRANELSIGFPDPRETKFDGLVNPTSKLPWKTPWRLIAIGSLANIVESTLGTDLAAPAKDIDWSWVEPGIASWSWIIHKDNSINFDTTIQYIDLAAYMNWRYCLIDVNWDRNIGYERMQELIDYARERNVELILWYNSAGDWNTTPYTPKNLLLTRESRLEEFRRISEMGISGIKVDFFGGDGQSVIAYYHDILEDAAKFQLTVNTHGCTLPRGWHRTYPHFVTAEAVKGKEFVTFTQENANKAPRHSVMQVFSRNVFDPMDFTPMNLTSIPGINRITTAAFELALPVLFTSGIQHMAETPEGMAKVPDFVKDFLRELPVQWESTRFIDGYPGEFAVLARQAINGWFIAGINGVDQPRELTLNLDFLPGGASGTLISDGNEWNSFTRYDVNENVTLEMKPNGGFVMFFPTN